MTHSDLRTSTVALAIPLILACGSSPEAGSVGSGGTTSSSPSSGGASATSSTNGIVGGSHTASGGASKSGTINSSGGASNGGTTTTAGVQSSGGSSAGASAISSVGGATTGGNTNGGTTSAGGKATGGVGGKATGGTIGSGGAHTGGNTSTGGLANGGSKATGGTATGGAGGGSTTAGTCSGHSNAVFSLVGWASGTSGGKGGTRVEVATGTALQAALKAQQKSTTPLTIVVTGTITPANSTEADGTPLSKIDVKDLSNVSIIGAGAGAELNGIGIKLMRASNVILRNLKIHHVLVGDKDAISIEGPVDHVWVDHCELYNTLQGVDKDYYDALLDAKDASQYLTYSWNYMHDSWKMSLVGYTETDTFDRKLTMHHNYIKNVNSRTPLIRGGSAHIFNNYYQDVLDTGINSRVGACVQIEQNYFSNAHNPWVSAFSGATGLGGAEDICNVLTNGSAFAFNSASEIFQVQNCTLNVPYDYASVLNAVDQVPSIVAQNAGVGKLANPESF